MLEWWPVPAFNQAVHLSNDIDAMRAALDQAAKGLFLTSPNPRVGCVIVRDGQIIASGHTQRAGEAHAEIDALRDAASRGIDVRGATVYVTLEPCGHHGRTPPCTEALITAGVSRVVAAIEDPNPLVAGKGIAQLRAAGITVETGVLANEAREMNIGFFHRMQHGRPWVRLKIAASLDGGTALTNGESQWITSSAARDDGHAWRARACAILTGIGTVQQDNPQLNVRAVTTQRQPQRIVVDSQMDIDLAAQVLAGGGTWIITTDAHPERASRLRDVGAEVIVLPTEGVKVDLTALMQLLGQRQMNELHVEAGHKLNGSLLRMGLVDEMLIYFAPCLLGPAQGMARLPELSALSDRITMRFHRVDTVGDDLRVITRLNNF